MRNWLTVGTIEVSHTKHISGTALSASLQTRARDIELALLKGWHGHGQWQKSEDEWSLHCVIVGWLGGYVEVWSGLKNEGWIDLATNCDGILETCTPDPARSYRHILPLSLPAVS
jgi:hypothetical protein